MNSQGELDRPTRLGKVPLFQGLARTHLEALDKLLVERRAKHGERIFDQGTRGDRMYIVISGKARVFLPGGDDQKSGRITLKELGPGEYFGELALFDDQPRSASVECIEPSLLLELSRTAFVDDVVRSPELVRAVLREMAGRLRSTYTQLSTHAAKDAMRELRENLSWSEQLADRVAELNGSWTFILFLIGIALAWSGLNMMLPRPFDGYPYVFFNLILGLLVALQGPLIVMSQNRQTTADRAQAASDFRVNLKNELGIETLLRELAMHRRETDRRLSSLEEGKNK